MIVLLDGDIIVYRIGFTTNEEPEWIAKARADHLIHSVMEEVGGTDLYLYLSDSLDNNFRYHIDNSYKANRAHAPRPEHYDTLKEHLITQWDAKIAHEQEADDALGIHQTNLGGDGVICSIDKDLLQIAGNHYNFVTHERKYVTIEEGTRFFYKQVLMGDVTENVQGIRGVGSQRSERLLEGCKTEEQCFKATHEAYQKFFKEEAEKELLKVGQLLKIRTREGEIWNLPVLPQQESRSSYIIEPEEAIIPYMGLGGMELNG